MENSVIGRVTERMELLPSDLQQLVWEFVQTLQATTQQGVPGRQLVHFAGAIPTEELERMNQAVTASCENVNLNAW